MRPLASLAALLFFAACASAPAPDPLPVEMPKPRPLLGQHGFDLAQMDRSLSPCDDFNEYANGGWRRAHPLPATYARYGQFEQVAERNRAILRDILESSAQQPGNKLGDFWSSCMNEAAAEAAGVEPIRGELARIEAISNRRELAAEIARQQLRAVYPVFRFGAQNDYRNSRMVIATVAQAGLGLPDREYYLRDDGSYPQTRRAYVEHITKLFALAGVANPAADAPRVLDLETRLARAQMRRVDQRNPENVYHLTPVSELQSYAPAFDWPAFFSTIGLGELKSLNVAQPEYLREASRLAAEEPLEAWKAYVRWRVIDEAAPYLSSPFANQDFEFRGQTLSGQKEMQPRWQRCIRAAEANLGDLSGQEYVKRTFTPAAKQKMNEMIDNLTAALREEIPALTWMSSETKRAALAKLDAFRRRIGYPDRWIDYSTLQIERDAHATNVFRARAFSFQRNVGRVGKPDDPNEWGVLTPSTVNAGYNPTRNDIAFPAGILQPPFYDPNADDAYNYGGIGAVIGHEMTHGFDDQGAKFDAEGNLRNWWTAEDLQRFRTRAECIANQYGAWRVEEGQNLQGNLVTGEAIADLGGLTIALRAYQRSLSGKPRLTLDGFTPEQRFFLGFAQVWAQNMAPEEARRRALTDPHAPGPARVNLTLQNMPEFATAWSCPTGARMNLPDGKRCRIW